MVDGRRREPVEAAFVACGAISAVGLGVEAIRQATRENRSGLTVNSEVGVPGMGSILVGAAPRLEADWHESDPAWRLSLTALKEALAKAEKVLTQFSSERIGFVLATTKANVEALERGLAGRPCSVEARRHLQANLLADDLACFAGARGLVRNVSLACTSGVAAIQMGARMIRRGNADAVIVAGVDHLSNFVTLGFSALKAIDRDGCRPFDAHRRGLSPGEAGACVVLARKDRLEGRPVLVRGWGNSNDANHMTGPSKEASGLTRAIFAGLSAAGVGQEEVDFVQAHATGTVYNDAMELTALRNVFGGAIPLISGAKGMLGHTLGAAGLVETIQCLCAMEDGLVPGTPRLENPDPAAPETMVLAPRKVKRLDTILKLSVGFGGINSCLVLGYE